MGMNLRNAMGTATRWLILGLCGQPAIQSLSILRVRFVNSLRTKIGICTIGSSNLEAAVALKQDKSGPTAIRTRVAGSASRRDIQATL